MTRDISKYGADDTLPTVFVDLDSTLCDTSHRHGMVDENGKADWLAYSMRCADDTPFEGTVALLRLLDQAGYFIVIVSGRHSEARTDTIDWLDRHAVPWDDLLLREVHGTGQSHADYKLWRINSWLEENEDHYPALAIDDWPEVRKTLEENGIPTLIVNPCYEGTVSETAQLKGMFV